MFRFIARMIETAAKKSLEEGQEKYHKYFVNTEIYVDYKEDVDKILIADGYEEVIPVAG